MRFCTIGGFGKAATLLEKIERGGVREFFGYHNTPFFSLEQVGCTWALRLASASSDRSESSAPDLTISSLRVSNQNDAFGDRLGGVLERM